MVVERKFHAAVCSANRGISVPCSMLLSIETTGAPETQAPTVWDLGEPRTRTSRTLLAGFKNRRTSKTKNSGGRILTLVSPLCRVPARSAPCSRVYYHHNSLQAGIINSYRLNARRLYGIIWEFPKIWDPIMVP